MDNWNKLSIKDKANYIKMGVSNGIRDLNTIRDTYNNVYAEGGNLFKDGGHKNNQSSTDSAKLAISNFLSMSMRERASYLGNLRRNNPNIYSIIYSNYSGLINQLYSDFPEEFKKERDRLPGNKSKPLPSSNPIKGLNEVSNLISSTNREKDLIDRLHVISGGYSYSNPEDTYKKFVSEDGTLDFGNGLFIFGDTLRIPNGFPNIATAFSQYNKLLKDRELTTAKYSIPGNRYIPSKYKYDVNGLFPSLPAINQIVWSARTAGVPLNVAFGLGNETGFGNSYRALYGKKGVNPWSSHKEKLNAIVDLYPSDFYYNLYNKRYNNSAMADNLYTHYKNIFSTKEHVPLSINHNLDYASDYQLKKLDNALGKTISYKPQLYMNLPETPDRPMLIDALIDYTKGINPNPGNKDYWPLTIAHGNKFLLNTQLQRGIQIADSIYNANNGNVWGDQYFKLNAPYINDNYPWKYGITFANGGHLNNLENQLSQYDNNLVGGYGGSLIMPPLG